MAYTYTSKVLTNSNHKATRTEAQAMEFSQAFVENTLIHEIEKASNGWLTYEEKVEDTANKNIYYRFKIKGEELYDLVWRFTNSWNTSGWGFTNSKDIWYLHLRSDTSLKQTTSWANTATNTSFNVNNSKITGNDTDGYDYTIEYRLDFITSDDLFAVIPVNNSYTQRSSFFIYSEHYFIFNSSATANSSKAFSVENTTAELTTETNAYGYDKEGKVAFQHPRFADGNRNIKFIPKKIANIYNNAFGTNNNSMTGSGSGLKMTIIKDDGTEETYMQVLGMWWIKE